MTQLQKTESAPELIIDIENMQNMSKVLMQTKHYQKIGEDGIFAICMVAKSINMPQLDALNGELYYVQGKVGMAYEAMNKYIRLAGHSVSIKYLDEKSCTLVGKRKDSGDVAEITYTLEDARRAGKSYDKHPKTMLFARCLSMLKRFLFPDVCTKVYVKEELDDFKDDQSESNTINVDVKPLYIETPQTISTSQANELNDLLRGCANEAVEKFNAFMKNHLKIEMIDDLPATQYDMVKTRLSQYHKENQTALLEKEMANKSAPIKSEDEGLFE
jgi:hypothetical protein